MSCSTYQICETRCYRSCSPCNRGCYEVNCIGKEKDILISQLKAHIFELELREKDFNILKERFNQLQHDIACLNQCKIQLECEKKMKDDNFNKNICQLQGEHENLQLGFNEKLTSNKTIFSENNALGKQIECKNGEICGLNAKINDLNAQLHLNDEERCNLQNNMNGLNDVKSTQAVKICQLDEDNKTLKNICNEQDCCLKAGDIEKAKLTKEFEIKNNEIQNLNCQIRQRICDSTNLENQLNTMNATNIQLQNNIKDLEAQLNGLKCENEGLKNALAKENAARIGENQKNTQLTAVLNDRDCKINVLNHDIDSVKVMQQNASGRNCVLKDENAKLRNHIMVLTDLNQNLMNEIDNVINEDEKMKCILDRKDRINSVLVNNRCSIDQSLNCLDEGINKCRTINCATPCCVVYDC